MSSEKIIEFDNIMQEFGYDYDDSKIYPEPRKEVKQINYTCEDGSAMGVYLFVDQYHNKKNYIYTDFMYNDYTKDPLKNQKAKLLAERILYEEKTRISEVGWEVVYTKQPDQFSMKDRKKIIFNIFGQIAKCLNCGIGECKPHPGDVLVSMPFGPKIDQGFTKSSIEVGSKQRGNIAKKFGFGSVYDDNFQYARYNDNLILESL